MRTCRDCKEVKPEKEFIKNKLFKDGIDTLCLICNRRRVKEWRQRNPDLRKIQVKRESYQQYLSGKAQAKAAKHRARKRNATPLWANQEKIAEIYLQALKEKKEVDHIIPLKGEKVSGLHVHYNLQLLTRKENRQKGNKFEGY